MQLVLHDVFSSCDLDGDGDLSSAASESHATDTAMAPTVREFFCDSDHLKVGFAEVFRFTSTARKGAMRSASLISFAMAKEVDVLQSQFANEPTSFHMDYKSVDVISLEAEKELQEKCKIDPCELHRSKLWPSQGMSSNTDYNRLLCQLAMILDRRCIDKDRVLKFRSVSPDCVSCPVDMSTDDQFRSNLFDPMQ